MGNRLDTVIADINAATNALADRITALIGRSTVTQAQLTELTDIRDRLSAMGTDPANPAGTPPDPAAPAAPETTPGVGG